MSGGTPQAFDPAFGGWRGPAFDAIGEWGLQKTLHTDNPDRSVFSAWNEATTIEQGALSTLSLDAHSAIWWAWLGWSPFAGRKGKQV